MKTSCSFCGNSFDIDHWKNGQCPFCHEEYWWEETREDDNLHWSKEDLNQERDYLLGLNDD